MFSAVLVSYIKALLNIIEYSALEDYNYRKYVAESIEFIEEILQSGLYMHDIVSVC